MNKTAKIAILVIAAGLLTSGLYFLLSAGNSFIIERDAAVENAAPAQNAGGAGGKNDAGGKGDSGKIMLAAVGDIMLSRNVEQKMIEKGDWKYPFLKTASITGGADLAFGNLETAILPGKIIPSGSFTFRTDPKALEGLKFAGFDVLSLANNHTMNFGCDGLRSTLQNLDGAGIGHVGAGTSGADMQKPVIREVKGVKFGFLAFSYSEDNVKNGGDFCGSAQLDTEEMKAQVAALRLKADVVVVSMHAGEEYALKPNKAQQDFARAAVEAGADLVVGHHSHTVQTFEKYQNGYIIYSLGNFVFDQMWSEETRLGAIAEITFENKKISKIEFVPVKIFDYAQPQPAEGEDKEKILGRLG